MKLPNAATTVALLGCIILLVLMLRARNELTLANAALASLKSANADLTARVAQLESRAIDDALLKRLQSDQHEAIKLRGEVSNLKQSLAAAKKNATAAAATTKTTAPQPGVAEEPMTNPYARVQTRKVSANLPFGHGLLLGGWQNESGKQTFAMAIPNFDPAEPGQVYVRTKIFEVTDEALGKLDTATLMRAAGQQATMTADQLASFEKALESTPGVSVLASPRMMLFSGRQGRASVGHQFPTPDGMIDVGTSMDLTPTLASNGTSVDLAVDAKLILPNTPPPPQ